MSIMPLISFGMKDVCLQRPHLSNNNEKDALFSLVLSGEDGCANPQAAVVHHHHATNELCPCSCPEWILALISSPVPQ